MHISVSRARLVLAALLIAVLSAWIFVPGLGGGFVFDDRPNIVQNTSLHLAPGANLDDLLYGIYSFQPGNGSRSLAMLSFAIDHWRGGLDPQVFKITNLVIHGITVFVLFFLIRRVLSLGGWPERLVARGALLLALVWAIHPLQVSSVLYVVQRMQTLVNLFMIAALWAYVCMRQAQIEGARSRGYGLLVALFLALGFACKEDAVLFPMYALLLELTILRFAASSPTIERVLSRGYGVLAVLGVVVYSLVVVPHYWSWDAYPGRDFSSYERLLTQARVLVMYLGQMLLPLPDSMHFYYDDLVVSRGVLSPVSTLVCGLGLVGLLVLALCFRRRRPVFAFGVLFFFAGHFMTSNVIGLELAFEHRNHLPLLGVALAFGDICLLVAQRLLPSAFARGWQVFMCIVVALLAVGTLMRASDWGEPLRFAQKSVDIAPLSERAWLQLGAVYAERSGMNVADPNFRLAIDACERGSRLTRSAPLMSNIVIFKTWNGSVSQADWDSFLRRLGEVPMSSQNQHVLWAMLANAEKGAALDERGMLELISVVSGKANLTAAEYLRVAAYIHNETSSPAEAFPYLERAVMMSPVGDPDIVKLFGELEVAGRADWERRLRGVWGAKAVARRLGAQ